MITRSRRTVLMTLATLAVGLLAACSGDSERGVFDGDDAGDAVPVNVASVIHLGSVVGLLILIESVRRLGLRPDA